MLIQIPLKKSAALTEKCVTLNCSESLSKKGALKKPAVLENIP